MGEGGFGKGGGFKGDGKGKKGGKKGKKGGKKGKGDDEKWVPCTKLGRLVEAGKIESIEDIYLHSLPIREYQIVDHFFAGRGIELLDEVCKIHPVQKMTSAGQRNRFVCYVMVGDKNGHIGLGNKVGKEVATAIRGAVIAAKLRLIPVRRGYWGARLGQPHTVPMKVTGKCGSVSVRLIPAPRGSGIVGSPTLKKLMAFAGVADVFSSSCGHTRTKGNFMKATFKALIATYSFKTPDFWPETAFKLNPYQEFTDELAEMQSKLNKAK